MLQQHRKVVAILSQSEDEQQRDKELPAILFFSLDNGRVTFHLRQIHKTGIKTSQFFLCFSLGENMWQENVDEEAKMVRQVMCTCVCVLDESLHSPGLHTQVYVEKVKVNALRNSSGPPSSSACTWWKVNPPPFLLTSLFFTFFQCVLLEKGGGLSLLLQVRSKWIGQGKKKKTLEKISRSRWISTFSMIATCAVSIQPFRRDWLITCWVVVKLPSHAGAQHVNSIAHRVVGGLLCSCTSTNYGAK